MTSMADMLTNMVQQVYADKGMPQDGINKPVVSEFAKRLTGALENGFGKQLANIGKSIDYNTPDALMLQKLSSSVWHFSAAKNHSQLRALSQALIGEDGKLRSWDQFKKEAWKINDQHVNQWLRAEYELSVASAQQAADWLRFQEDKHLFPYLQFDVVLDNATSDICRPLHNVIVHVDDPWWQTYYPPNAFNCRCTVIQETCDSNTPDAQTYAAGKAAKVPPLFKTNSGITKAVFATTHPYFKASNGKLHELDAVKNYGMKNWHQMQAQSLRTAQPLPPPKTKAEFNSWWNDMVANHGIGSQNFVLKDATGNHVLFDAKPERNKPTFFREHVIKEGHFDVAANIQNILQQPDEMWSFHSDGDLAKPMVHTYIKYFKEDILAIYATQSEGVIKAETCYRILNQKTFDNLRKGYLNIANKSQ